MKDVVSRDETDAGLALAFTLEARNENEVALPLRLAEYEFEIAEGESGGAMRRVFTGVRSPEATLNPNSDKPVMLPAVIPLRDEGGAASPRPVGVHEYRFWVRLTYITPGALAETLFDTGVRRPTVTYSHTGRIDFGEGPGAAARLVVDEARD